MTFDEVLDSESVSLKNSTSVGPVCIRLTSPEPRLDSEDSDSDVEDELLSLTDSAVAPTSNMVKEI